MSDDLNALGQYGRERDLACRGEVELPSAKPRSQPDSGPSVQDLDRYAGANDRTPSAAEAQRVRDTWRRRVPPRRRTVPT